MARELVLLCTLLLSLLSTLARSQYATTQESVPYQMERETHLHFYLHDIISGNNPTAVEAARANYTSKFETVIPFGSLYIADDPMTEGPGLDSKEIGRAQGLYVSAGQDKLILLLAMDFGFTEGEFKESSLAIYGRNQVSDELRELPVVGGRGKFRMARGYAQVRTHFFNMTNGDAVLDYQVTVFHY